VRGSTASALACGRAHPERRGTIALRVQRLQHVRVLRVLDAIADVPAASWDALLPAGHPFAAHAFLEALEHTGCAGPKNGWRPRHLTPWDGPELIAAAPAYARDSSDGDFSRDWQWASALERGGHSYYPKLLLSTPFTPVTGPRVRVKAGVDRAAAVAAIV